MTNVATGEVEQYNTYTPGTDTLQTHARFGETLLTYTYNSAGQLASFIDGDNNTTALGNYYRGIPQLISYPDNTSQSAAVDDYGEITSVTDQAGHTTSYTYNAVGWPSQISYPSGDEVAWYPTNYAFAYVTTAEQGIAGGHWRRTVTTGNDTEVTYFDAMLHPLLSDSSIAGTAGSDITTANSYDWRGLTTFASYPVSGAPALSAVTTGTHKTYDTLGRLTQSQQDSELGTLTSSTAYLSGASVQVTDPNNNVTTTSYQVFDTPSYNAPIKVQAPAGVTQTIARDLYGNPTAITQSGLYNGTENDSVSKTLTYDSYHRLCRTTEPESGDSVMAYDGANNLQWSANGLSITGTGCGQSQVAAAVETVFAYDPTNRVKTVTPPSGTQSTQYIYDAVGNLQWATSGATVWNGTYNDRNMLTGESLNVVGQPALALGYAHDANGNLSLIRYPNGENVSYAPDARGRPTQVGSYASQVGYFPNGAVASFTYGNGAGYVAQQNARQLLSNFSYGAGSTLNVSEDMVYDNDGNITNVNDLTGGQRSKQFQYDGLNRLTSAVAPSLWGTESYTYDPLNNLRTRLSAGQTSVYNYDATNRLLTITRAGSTIDSFGYDTRGNETLKNGVTLQFDQKDQLTQIVGSDSYGYDASGRRVQKNPANGGAPTDYFYDHGGQLMYQYAAGTATATNFIYLGSKLIARNSSLQLVAPGAFTFNSNPSNGSYTVSWGAVPAATSYTLQESANGGAWTTVYTGSAPSAALSGRAGGSYAYQVQGCAGSTCGGWTGSATLGVWPAAPTNPAGPGGLTYAPFTVTWTASPGVATYTVQQSFNGGAWTTLASGITTPSYSVTSAKGGTYTYQVAASNAYGSSGWTASAPVSVTQVPATPTNFAMSTTNGVTSMTWNAMPWATSYNFTALGKNGHLGTYTYVVATNSYNFPSGSYTAQQLTACSIAGCSAPLQISGQFTVGGGAAQTSAVMTKPTRVLGADTGSGSGCNASTCSVTLGGNP
ncbi:hypothetical protein B0E46_04725 [Rhodanobacter sp. B04]|uniref:hypothetical protein n=1 Tax=Rhodanobacter sp. B04 TaxID=1945860 RepID=UPI000986C1FB|nr:hypothetical protein [Rhodanobacter sp. B04]OOG64721.1 hypothetical protein B0E46_04725 [Rhodanobacter sp. B04]